MRLPVALLALLWVAGGCTALLARQGDPDLSVLYRGAERETIEAEVGKADGVEVTATGSTVVYEIKLGAPKNPKGTGASLRYAGIGAAAGAGIGITTGVIAHAATLGTKSGTPVGVAAGVAVAGAVWLVGESIGTVGELVRLSQREPYRLEVSYDKDSRMVRHELHPIGDGD